MPDDDEEVDPTATLRQLSLFPDFSSLDEEVACLDPECENPESCEACQ